MLIQSFRHECTRVGGIEESKRESHRVGVAKLIQSSEPKRMRRFGWIKLSRRESDSVDMTTLIQLQSCKRERNRDDVGTATQSFRDECVRVGRIKPSRRESDRVGVATQVQHALRFNCKQRWTSLFNHPVQFLRAGAWQSPAASRLRCSKGRIRTAALHVHAYVRSKNHANAVCSWRGEWMPASADATTLLCSPAGMANHVLHDCRPSA